MNTSLYMALSIKSRISAHRQLRIIQCFSRELPCEKGREMRSEKIILLVGELMNQISFLGRSSVILIKGQIICLPTDKGSKKNLSQFSQTRNKLISYLLNWLEVVYTFKSYQEKTSFETIHSARVIA